MPPAVSAPRAPAASGMGPPAAIAPGQPVPLPPTISVPGAETATVVRRGGAAGLWPATTCPVPAADLVRQSPAHPAASPRPADRSAFPRDQPCGAAVANPPAPELNPAARSARPSFRPWAAAEGPGAPRLVTPGLTLQPRPVPAASALRWAVPTAAARARAPAPAPAPEAATTPPATTTDSAPDPADSCLAGLGAVGPGPAAADPILRQLELEPAQRRSQRLRRRRGQPRKPCLERQWPAAGQPGGAGWPQHGAAAGATLRP